MKRKHQGKSEEAKKKFEVTPDELRDELKIPKDFQITASFGVPIEEITREYLIVLLTGAIYEGRVLRDRIQKAMEKGEELNAEEKKKAEEKTAE